MKTAEPKTPLTVHIPVSLRRHVEQAASSAGQSLSTWIERAINAVLLKGKTP